MMNEECSHHSSLIAAAICFLLQIAYDEGVYYSG